MDVLPRSNGTIAPTMRIIFLTVAERVFINMSADYTIIPREVVHYLITNYFCTHGDHQVFHQTVNHVYFTYLDKYDGLYQTFNNCFITRSIVYKEGLPHGICQRWHPSGRLSEKYIAIDGKIHGSHKTWFFTGQLQTKCTYVNGFMHGISRMWHYNGQIASKKCYRNNKLHGVLQLWDDHGHLSTQCNFVDGKLHGICRSWDPGNTLKSRQLYINGSVE